MLGPLQKGKKEDVSKYFENLLPGGKVYFSGNREINPGLQVVELDTIPHNAKFLYVTGFKYLALKPEAVDFLKKCSETQLRQLIEQKKETYPADVPILEQALELKKAVGKKQ
ncbi:MAG: hypothetical protein Q4A09_08755 [Capnocytophaga felis]|uniref:hypothetical protein n=1 Tax=Capnocytophaga canimorsus TaxID=28188 RepID=UPI00270D8AA6|nr:hypothetical protein [Capnocytophaga felis]